MSRADILVVGGGPAGATAAMLLAKQGLDVALLDRESFPRDKPCGEFVNPAACDLLHSVFGLTRQDLIIAGGTPVSKIRLQLKRCPALEIPMVDATGNEVFGVSLRRTTADSLLIDACRRAGVRVLENHNVRKLERQGDQVILRGDGFTFEAPLVIAADGTHSTLARQEGLTVPKPKLGTIGIVAHFQGVPPSQTNEPSVWMFPSSGDGTMFGFSRQANGSAVLSGSAPKRFARRVSADPEGFLRAWIAHYPELQAVLENARIDGQIQTTACFGHALKRPFAPGVLFLGDAARFADPFTGEGIHHAIESGVIASRIALKAIQTGDAGARALSAYESERGELSKRYSLCELVSGICLKPRLINYIGERLRERPELGQTLIGALVDILPSRAVLDARFILRALAP